MTQLVATVAPQAKITNRSDMAYAEYLEALRTAGMIREWHYQKLTLVLGADCRYTPDFFVVRVTGECELHEVKGFWRDDAKAKARVCASMFPFRVLVAQMGKKADKGKWIISEAPYV